MVSVENKSVLLLPPAWLCNAGSSKGERMAPRWPVVSGAHPTLGVSRLGWH